ncbi:MAG: primosomal protein N', partial [Candidatus Krumholzibacteriota bacterium]|nr:primosomal protein N' [Candidatus Krumholzibacteriota bacterium]
MGKKSVTPFADIALPVPVDKEFTYQIPPSLESDIAPGARVIVPFGGRRMTGYVMRLRDRSPDRVRLKAISRLVDDIPLLHGSLLELAAWMADYYVHPVGEILRAMLPPAVKGKGRLPREEEGTGQFPEEAERPPLNPAQREVFEAVRDSIRAARADRYFLFGVTGSGKTEVYLRAIDEALGGGKSALVLIPEIALIPQTTSRFRRRFGRDIAVLHSRLTGAQRASIWKGASRGEIRVVIGPRSAVFVPLRDLGIIVVDEEQDSSYKQEEKPHYNAVAVAAVRAQMEKAVLLLGSATPSLETYQSARRGELRQFRLDSRPHREPMPSVDIVDMREREGIFSDELLDA